jgi:hypothetical protein
LNIPKWDILLWYLREVPNAQKRRQKMPKSMFSDAYRQMLKVLVDTRRERRLTQARVAAALGKPQSFIAKIEGGERRLDVIEFCAIAQAMDMQPVELLSAIQKVLPNPVII